MFLNDDVGSSPGQDIVKVHDKKTGDEFSRLLHVTTSFQSDLVFLI